MAGGFELLIVVDAKGTTVFEVGIDLIPSGEIQTLESCGGTKRQIPTTSGTTFSDFQFLGSLKHFRHVRFAQSRSFGVTADFWTQFRGLIRYLPT
jgi:hypothetical protein